MHYLRLIRFPNLLIVAGTQYLLQYFYLLPLLQSLNLKPAISSLDFMLLILVTMLIAAGGYVINDLLDLQIDAINKPNRMILGKKIPVKHGWIFYYLISIFGLIISIYLAWRAGNPLMTSIYPAAVMILFAYAQYFKRSLLFGNLIVSLFSAGVAGIVLFVERDNLRISINSGLSEGRFTIWVLGAFIFFAFCISLFRELVKDMEDLKGDRAAGCKTLPIVWGIRNAKWMTNLVGFALLIGLAFVCLFFLEKNFIIALCFNLLFVLVPVCYAIYLLSRAQEPEQFRRVSRWIKGVMVNGMILLVILAYSK